MPILQCLLGRSDRFFDLLGTGADEARQSVRSVIELVRAPDDSRALEKSLASRKQEKLIHEQITTMVCSTAVTPLEREDIEALSGALSRITKLAKKFAQRLLLSRSHVRTDIFSRQAAILERAADTLCEMVHSLGHGARLQSVEEQNNRMQQCEGEADKLMLDLMNQLYSGQYDTRQMIVTRDLLDMLEKIVDRHRDAGNIIFQLVLKNS